VARCAPFGSVRKLFDTVRCCSEVGYFGSAVGSQSFYQDYYQEYLSLVKSLRPIFATSGVYITIDLGNEKFSPGGSDYLGLQQFNNQMWSDYVQAFGKADTYGFSAADAYRLDNIPNVYQGNEPAAFEVHLGAPQADANLEHACDLLSSTGRTQTFVIGEVPYVDTTTASQLSSANAYCGNKIRFLTQYPFQPPSTFTGPTIQVGPYQTYGFF